MSKCEQLIESRGGQPCGQKTACWHKRARLRLCRRCALNHPGWSRGHIVPLAGIADAARIVLAEKRKRQIWYGDPGLCHDVYEFWAGSPTQRKQSEVSAVLIQLSHAPGWDMTGYAIHKGRVYRVFKPVLKPG